MEDNRIEGKTIKGKLMWLERVLWLPTAILFGPPLRGKTKSSPKRRERSHRKGFERN
jgi:hypothetical protein